MCITTSKVQVVIIEAISGQKITFLIPYINEQLNLFVELKKGNVYLSQKGVIKYLLSLQRLDFLADYFNWQFDHCGDLSTPCYVYRIHENEVIYKYVTFELLD